MRALTLRGNLRGAVAVGLEDETNYLAAIRRTGGRDSRSADFETVRALLAEDSGGNRQGVAVREVVDGPENLLYILLQEPIVVGDKGFLSNETELCAIFVANRQTGAVTCIDRELDAYGCQAGYWMGLRNPCLQVDQQGRLHYFGVSWRFGSGGGSGSSTLVLRRYDPATGERRDLIPSLPVSEFGINDYLLLKDGSVLVTGYSGGFYGGPAGCSVSSSWLKWLPSDGSRNVDITGSCASFLQEFPDGNIYFGSPQGMRRILMSDGSIGPDPRGALETRPWIAPASDDPSRAPYFDAEDLCPDPFERWGVEESWSVGPCDENAETYLPGYGVSGGLPYGASLLRDGDRVFYAESYRSDGLSLAKVYDSESAPHPAEYLWTRQRLVGIQQAAAEGGRLVLYGRRPSSQGGGSALAVQDPDGVEQEIVSEEIGEIEVFSLASLNNGEVAFSGWSLERNNQVLGVVDVGARTARITEEIDGRISVIIPLD